MCGFYLSCGLTTGIWDVLRGVRLGRQNHGVFVPSGAGYLIEGVDHGTGGTQLSKLKNHHLYAQLGSI